MFSDFSLHAWHAPGMSQELASCLGTCSVKCDLLGLVQKGFKV